MDFLGLFWIASLLSSYVSTTPQWDQLEESIRFPTPTDATPQAPASDTPDPLIASLPKTFSPPLNWDMWSVVPDVSVVASKETATASYSPPGSCFPDLTSTTPQPPRFQVWLHDSLIGTTSQAQAAQHVANKLRQLISSEQFSAKDIRPLLSDHYAAVGLNQEILFVVDENFGVPARQQPLAAVYWTNNLRRAFEVAPVDLATAQMAALGMTSTDQQFSGLASWYGPNFHGQLTATGEIFDQHELTAAHPTLPFGTYLKVRNQLNNKTVVVRVNDRGPYIGNRSLDLSYAAAQCLGSEQVGVVPYEATILRSEVPQWIAQDS